MCNDYRLEVAIASIAEDFDDLQIKIKMPEGTPMCRRVRMSESQTWARS